MLCGSQTDPQCQTLCHLTCVAVACAVACLDTSWLLQCNIGWSEWSVDGMTSVCCACRCSADLLQTEVRAHNTTAHATALVVCTWAHSVQTCSARFPLSLWYCSAIPNWPAAAAGSLGFTQKAAILSLGQTGHPAGMADYHRWPCILCRWSSRVEQFVIINAESTFVTCI